MGDNSKIEWLNLMPGFKGASWNCFRGCTPVDPGCDNCYAAEWATMPSMSGCAGKPYHGLVQIDKPGNKWNGEVRFAEDMLDHPLRWKQPRLIFTNSMSDWLHAGFSDDQVFESFEVMKRADWHVFMTLTRRTQRLKQFCAVYKWPPHIWAGVTVPSAKYNFRIDHLRACDVPTRWISFEPLIADIGPVDLTGIHWAVIGGESGDGDPIRPMHSRWVSRLIDQCREQGVPVFFKQWGRTCPISQLPPGVNFDPRKKAPTILIDEDGRTGAAEIATREDDVRRQTGIEMHLVASKAKTGRLWNGAELNEYPDATHFPARRAAA